MLLSPILMARRSCASPEMERMQRSWAVKSARRCCAGVGTQYSKKFTETASLFRSSREHAREAELRSAGQTGRLSLRGAGQMRASVPKGERKTGKPLQDVRVLVGRARHQAGSLSTELRKLGADVLEIPFIEIRKPRSFRPLDTALKHLQSYDWLILTSVNGVDAMWERLRKLRLNKQSLRHLKIAAIGPATRKAIEERGARVNIVPKEYVAESR